MHRNTAFPILPLAAVSLALLLIPLLFFTGDWRWLNDFQWHPPAARLIFLITQTGTMPYALITAGGLAALLTLLAKPKRKTAFLLLLLASMAATQLTKSVLKNHFAEPRPYISAINDADPVKIRLFYAQSLAEKRRIVTNYYQTRAETPSYLTAHRVQEIAYSFPSGHTIFAATWALLFAAFAGWRITVIVSLWAAAVMASRVWLGMHTPQDLTASVILAFFINAILIGLYRQSAKRSHSRAGSEPL